MSCEKQTQALALLLEPRCAPAEAWQTHMEDAACLGWVSKFLHTAWLQCLALGADKLRWARKVQKHEI